MPKFDKEFFINDFEEKYDLCKHQLMNLVKNHYVMTEDELINELSMISEMICYFSDLLEILKE